MSMSAPRTPFRRILREPSSALFVWVPIACKLRPCRLFEIVVGLPITFVDENDVLFLQNIFGRQCGNTTCGRLGSWVSFFFSSALCNATLSDSGVPSSVGKCSVGLLLSGNVSGTWRYSMQSARPTCLQHTWLWGGENPRFHQGGREGPFPAATDDDE